MIQENLAVPFQTMVLGVNVVVEHVDVEQCDQIVAICSAQGDSGRRLSVREAPLPDPLPDGAE